MLTPCTTGESNLDFQVSMIIVVFTHRDSTRQVKNDIVSATVYPASWNDYFEDND